MNSSSVLEIVSIETFSSTNIFGSTAWLTLASSIKSHPLIAQSYYGFRVESPNFLEVAISLSTPCPDLHYSHCPSSSSITHYVTVWKAEVAEDFNHLLYQAIGNITTTILPFAIAAETAMSAPVTERATFTAPKAGLEEQFREFVAEAISPEADCLGSTSGFACPPKDTTFVALLGWTSVQAHEAVGRKQSFSKAAKGIMELANEVNMWHVGFERL